MRTAVALAWLAMPLAACVTPPKDTAPALLDRAPLDTKTEGIRAGYTWPQAGWWKAFGDPQLDALIAQALTSAPSLNTAQARILAARAGIGTAMSDSSLRLSANAGVSRQRLSENQLISSRLIGFTWYNQADAQLKLDIDFDWWGGRRAGINAALTRFRAAEAERKEAELVLAAAVASNYLAWQTEVQRAGIVKIEVDALQSLRRLQASRVRQGIDAADSLDAVEIEQALAADRLVSLQGLIETRRLALAALLGVPTDRLPLSAAGCAVVRHLEQPPQVGLGLIARRPDIVASRWRVEAAAGDVAQARAGYYPDIRLSALIGLSSTDLSKFLNVGSRVASIGSALYLPIFDARGVRARYGVQRAELELAVADYNGTVVVAAHDVATQVLAWAGFSAHRVQLLRSVDAARNLQKASAALADQGIDDARAQLRADAEVLRAEDASAAAEGDLVLARIALIKALGGGTELVGVDAGAVPNISNFRQ